MRKTPIGYTRILMRGLGVRRVIPLVLLLSVGARAGLLEECRARRTALLSSLSDSVVVLFGRTEEEADSSRSGFFQEPNFYYLTGWSEPGAVLLLRPGQDESAQKQILFLPRGDPDRERYTGRRASSGDPGIKGLTGFQQVMPVAAFEAELAAALKEVRHVYALASNPSTKTLGDAVSPGQIVDASREIARLRMKKSPFEVALIRKAIEASVKAHEAAWKRIVPGIYEYQVAAEMTAVYLDRGCERNAFSPIVASGPNAVILHYDKRTRRLESGELVLMDVGAECSGYAADITRTVPVDGKFSQRQKELYEVVLGAQEAVIKAIKPGMMLGKTSPNSLFKIARQYMDSHGKDENGQPLGEYLPHDVSHHVGLDVHDASDLSVPLEAGMVISVEPGIYIPEEGLGIRIEDMVLVTENGAEVLTYSLPKQLLEIERAVGN